MIAIHNTLLNSNVLEKYLRNNRREILHYLTDRMGIFTNWKQKLEKIDNSENFSREVPNYPYFQENLLTKLLDYAHEIDWAYEDPDYTGTGRVEFTIIDNNKLPILFIEIKGQKQGLDKPQSGYAGKTPVQQANSYAMNSKNVIWYIIFNYDELRLYNKFEGYLSEKYISFKFSELSEDDFFYLILLLSKKFYKEQRLVDEIKKETLIVERKITDQIYDLYHETRLILIRQIQNHNELDSMESIRISQLLLNRIIFVCFAEDRGLLPNQILENIIHEQIEKKTLKTNRCSIWNEINFLFEDIDTSNRIRNVTGYDGILFEEKIGFIKLPDTYKSKDIFNDLKQDHSISNDSVSRIVRIYQNTVDGFINPLFYNVLLLASFDYNSDIDVNILGHIFEQSLTDLEELQEDLDLEAKAERSRTLRKKEGIFYTPEYVTEFICRNTIIPYLSKDNSNTAEELADEYSEELELLEEKLSKIKILDPACGSGAFLKKAMEVLLDIHKLIYLKRLVGKIEDDDNNTEEGEDGAINIMGFLPENGFSLLEIDKRREIASNNLFGVDINAESIGITNLSLFLKTVKKNEQLPHLTENIKCGNSLIDNENDGLEIELANKYNAFNWSEEFTEILNDGFDLIIGNPPYIRRENIEEEIKPILKTKFLSYQGAADLYCYFYEKSLDLLKPNGILGFISSNKWMKAGYGGKLRSLLNSFHIMHLIDFFELRVFKDASTEPAIVIIRKIEEKNKEIKVSLMDTLEFNDFNYYVKNNQFNFNQEDLIHEEIQEEAQESLQSMGIWNFTSTIVNDIINKMKEDSVLLKDYLGENSVKMGIKAERINIFRIDQEKYDELINADSKAKEIIKPMLVGTDIEQYSYEFQNFYFILMKQGINIEKYPSIKEYFEENREELEQRDSVQKGESDWYELRPCNYYNYFESDKIVYIRIAKKHKFALDKKRYYLTDNSYIINSSERYLLGFLNSKLFEFYKKNSFVAFGDPRSTGRCKLDHKKMLDVPIKPINDDQKQEIIELVNKAIKLKNKFIIEKNNLLEFLKSNYSIDKISKKIQNFWNIESSDFLDELKKLKITSVDELKQLSDLFNSTMNNEIKPLLNDIAQINEKINSFIYNIYNIEPNERILIEQFVS